jgi:hypothetical protein
LVFPVLLLGAAVLAAWWLRRRAGVPLVMLAVAAGFSLLSLLAGILVIAAIRTAGVRNGLPWAAVGWPATVAVCAETFRYLSFRAGPVMRANRTSVGALMAGLGYGGIIVIYAVTCTLALAAYVHAVPGLLLLGSFWAAAGIALVVLVHRSG